MNRKSDIEIRSSKNSKKVNKIVVIGSPRTSVMAKEFKFKNIRRAEFNKDKVKKKYFIFNRFQVQFSLIS